MKSWIPLVLLFTTCASLKINHDTGDNYELCDTRNKCVKKCCPEKHVLKNKICIPSDKHGFAFDIHDGIKNITDSNITFHIIHDYNSNCGGKTVLKLAPKFLESDKFFVQSDGSIYKPFDNVTRTIEFENYCLETFILPTREDFSALVCYGDDKLEKIDKVYYIGMIISMPFLFITFLVYLILPERNVHRRALINYVFSLLLSYIFLVTVQLLSGTTAIETGPCHFIAYAIIFFFIVSFCWLNVMCLDMWLAFSNLRGFSGKRNAEKKKFIMFCIYAWGMPALLILLTYLMNTYGDKDTVYHPKIGEGKCFLSDGYPNLFYFYLPMAVLITANLVLCILTAFKIRKVKKETSMLKRVDSNRHNYENDKQKFKLYLKLVFAMGVNWSTEVISWAINSKYTQTPDYIWYLTDFTNAIYGVFIFFIFVFKKNIYYQLQKRYYVWRGKPHLAHKFSSTQTTRTANLSTTDASVSHDFKMADLRNGKVEERPLSVK